MTPEEAKTKWCPMGGIGPHRQTDMPQGSACIADRCMAWRWGTERDYENAGTRPPSEVPIVQSTTNGYCGLAGKPS